MTRSNEILNSHSASPLSHTDHLLLFFFFVSVHGLEYHLVWSVRPSWLGPRPPVCLDLFLFLYQLCSCVLVFFLSLEYCKLALCFLDAIFICCFSVSCVGNHQLPGQVISFCQNAISGARLSLTKSSPTLNPYIQSF